MLKRFAVKNYRGFQDRIEWNLSNPSNYSFNSDAVKNGVVRNGIIYGPNGSGKSNFGLAIFDIANHLSHKWKKPDYYLNYACALDFQHPVEFEYTFGFNGRVVNYNYSKVASELKGIIISERLIVDGNELLRKDSDTLFVAPEFGLTEMAINNLKRSENNISIVNYLLGAVPFAKDHPLITVRDFVENMLFFRSLDNREFIGLKEGGSNIEEYILKNNLVNDFSAYLKEVSGQDYMFAPNVQGENILYCIMGNVRIPFQMVASTGTKSLELQYYWLKEIENATCNASFVFIDEFDAFYHHELSYKICKRLFQGDNQLFVTTHDTFLLSNDLLRPDCFFILQGNKINAICDLTEKELRFGHNLEKLYRGGTFSL
ncbi:MAG: ATP/GTP-binding protein [Muribaculaceae bacterium]